MYNKNQYRKFNDKKILHKVKKQWVTISLVLFMMLGGGAVASNITASANNNNQNQQAKVQVKLNKPKQNNSITNQAKALHNQLMSNATQRVVNNQNKRIINLSKHHVTKQPVKKIKNVNQLKLYQSGVYEGHFYNRVRIPFNRVLIKRKSLLHSNINAIGHKRDYFGALYRGQIVKISRAFREYFNNNSSYINYEIPLAHKRNAFITSNNRFVSYIAPTTNYRYYQYKINYILNHSHNKRFNNIRKAVNNCAKREIKSYRTYMGLYVEAYNTQQALKHPVIFNSKNKQSHKANINKHISNGTTQNNEVNSLESNTNHIPSSAQSYSYASASNNGYIAPSFMSAIIAPVVPSLKSNSVTPESNSASNVVPSSASQSSSVSASSSVASNNASNTSSTSATTMSASSSTNSNNSGSSKSSAISSKAQSNSVSSKINSTASSTSSSTSTSSSNSTSVNSSHSSASKSNTSSGNSSNNSTSNNSSIINGNTGNKQSKNVLTGNSDGLNYKYYTNTNTLEFISGRLQSNLLLFYIKNTDISKNVKHVKFDSNVDVSNVKDMQGAFNNLINVESIDLGDNFDTSNATNMYNMFGGDQLLRSLNLGNHFDTSKVTDMGWMFSNDMNLSSLNLGNHFNTSSVTNMSDMFFNAGFKSLTLPNSFITTNVTNMSNMFSYIRPLQSLSLPNSFDTHNVTNMYLMFGGNWSLQSLNLGNHFDTSKVTNMSNMFMSDYDLQSLDLGNKFDTNNVTDMSFMFDDDNRLQSLDLGSKFDTSNVTNMNGMFAATDLQSLNLGKQFDTNHVTNMSSMFWNSTLQSLDLGNKFDTSNVTNMNNMFGADSDLKSLDLGDHFNTGKVTDMNGMFESDDKLQSLDLGNDFNTSNVTDMSTMFDNDSALQSLDLGNKFDTSKVTDMSGMFDGDTNLHSLNLGNKFDTSKVTDMSEMFGFSDDLSKLSKLIIGSSMTKFNKTSGIIPYTWERQGNVTTDNLVDGNSHVGVWNRRNTTKYKNKYDTIPVDYPSNLSSYIKELSSDAKVLKNKDIVGLNISKKGKQVNTNTHKSSEPILDSLSNTLVDINSTISDISDTGVPINPLKHDEKILENDYDEIDNILNKVDYDLSDGNEFDSDDIANITNIDKHGGTNYYYEYNTNLSHYVHSDVLHVRDNELYNNPADIIDNNVSESMNFSQNSDVIRNTNKYIIGRDHIIKDMKDSLNDMERQVIKLRNVISKAKSDISKAKADISAAKAALAQANKSTGQSGNNNSDNTSSKKGSNPTNKQNTSNRPKSNTITYDDVLNHSESIKNGTVSRLARFGAEIMGITARDTGFNILTSTLFIIKNFSNILNSSDRSSDVKTHCRYITGEDADWIHKQVKNKLMPAKTSADKITGGWSVKNKDNSKALEIMPGSDIAGGIESTISKLTPSKGDSKLDKILKVDKMGSGFSKIQDNANKLANIAYIVIPWGKSQTVDPSDNIFTDH